MILSPGFAGLGRDPFTVYAPYRDTRQTVAAIRDKFHETFRTPAAFGLVRAASEMICDGLADKDYASEYAAIGNFVAARVHYVRDPEPVELVKGPDVLLGAIFEGRRPMEDCESIALLIGSLCAAVGGRVRVVTAGFERGAPPANWPRDARWPPHTHAFAQALDPSGSRWLTLDPVAGPRARWMLSNATTAAVYLIN